MKYSVKKIITTILVAVLCAGFLFNESFASIIIETAPGVFTEQKSLEKTIEQTAQKAAGTTIEQTNEKTTGKTTDSTVEITTNKSEKTENAPEGFSLYKDVLGRKFITKINPNVPANKYNEDLFVHDGYKVSYNDNDYVTRLGVDVSYHQGTIDWEKVKADGYTFAFIRIGFRGYGEEGTLNEDTEFRNNIKNAKKAGLDGGVYFIAQAINEKEAVEEAEYVINLLKGQTLELPVVYDPETVGVSSARTNSVTKSQFTANTLAFCDRIKQAGYDAAVYANMRWQADKLDMGLIKDIPMWYADYEAAPQSPYHFEYWQYSESAVVDGIPELCDVDVQFIKKIKSAEQINPVSASNDVTTPDNSAEQPDTAVYEQPPVLFTPDNASGNVVIGITPGMPDSMFMAN